jgi:hypothetical protein
VELTIPKTMMDACFALENGIVRLRCKAPSTTAGLLVLLYGYLALKGQTSVPAGMLNAAASVSEIDVTRLDRELESVADMVTAAGERRGRRYMLTANGVRYAETVLRKAQEGGPNAKTER